MSAPAETIEPSKKALKALPEGAVLAGAYGDLFFKTTSAWVGQFGSIMSLRELSNLHGGEICTVVFVPASD